MPHHSNPSQSWLAIASVVAVPLLLAGTAAAEPRDLTASTAAQPAPGSPAATRPPRARSGLARRSVLPSFMESYSGRSAMNGPSMSPASEPSAEAAAEQPAPPSERPVEPAIGQRMFKRVPLYWIVGDATRIGELHPEQASSGKVDLGLQYQVHPLVHVYAEPLNLTTPIKQLATYSFSNWTNMFELMAGVGTRF